MLNRLRGRRRRSLDQPPADRVEGLERRVADLERMLEALQDAVHREWVRHEAKTAQLERKTQASEIARALNEDARRRGI